MYGHYYSFNGNKVTSQPSIRLESTELNDAITEDLEKHKGPFLITKSRSFATLSVRSSKKT